MKTWKTIKTFKTYEEASNYRDQLVSYDYDFDISFVKVRRYGGKNETPFRFEVKIRGDK